MLQLNQLNYR